MVLLHHGAILFLMLEHNSGGKTVWRTDCTGSMNRDSRSLSVCKSTTLSWHEWLKFRHLEGPLHPQGLRHVTVAAACCGKLSKTTSAVRITCGIDLFMVRYTQHPSVGSLLVGQNTECVNHTSTDRWRTDKRELWRKLCPGMSRGCGPLSSR